MGISLKGIHFHCGSGKDGSLAFKKSINMARACLEVGRKYGHSMEILDLGGGFPAGEVDQNMMDALLLTKNDPLGYKVIAEPGRHLSAHCGYVFTRVL